MKADRLEMRARIRAMVRSYHADLRYFGVDEELIRACKTLHQLDHLKARVVAYLMTQQEPSLGYRDPRKAS